MISIYGKTFTHPYGQQLLELFKYLDKKKMRYSVEHNFMRLLKEEVKLDIEADTFSNFNDVKAMTEVVFSIGGDGTILDTVVMVKDSEIPIFGINFGRLGFLASVGKEHLHAAIDAVERGQYMIDRRTLIELESNKPLFSDNFALNDMTIQRRAVKYDYGECLFKRRVAEYLLGRRLDCSHAHRVYRLLIKLRGPIIYPSSGNFVITPVAPHNLNVRPMVVNDDVILSFEVTGRGESFLCTLDSRFCTIDASFQLAVKKAGFYANIVRLTDQSFISALKTKLNWGTDQRN